MQVAALYFIGMTGHFGLGNTNTLATIDVAGAFNVIFSYYSQFVDGYLVFFFLLSQSGRIYLVPFRFFFSEVIFSRFIDHRRVIAPLFSLSCECLSGNHGSVNSACRNHDADHHLRVAILIFIQSGSVHLSED